MFCQLMMARILLTYQQSQLLRRWLVERWLRSPATQAHFKGP